VTHWFVDPFASKGDDLAGEENDIDLGIGEEQDEKTLRSSGEPNLPKDGWKGDQGDEIEEKTNRRRCFRTTTTRTRRKRPPRFIAKDNETPKSVAKKFGCSAAVIVRLNEPKDGTRMFQTSKYKIFWRECAS
jgi:hypothetical protein